MAIFTVGPNSTFPSIAAAMAAAGPGDTIQLEAGYSNETATVTHSGMIITGEASSTGIVLQLGSGIATVTLAGEAPFNLIDASDGNGILGNDGANLITVTAGADAVGGGLGDDRLFVDYRLATGAVTGDSTSNVAEAGGGGRLVTINGGFEHFTIWTGSGADTITTGAGDDDIRTGEGAGTVTAGEGANIVIGGSGADTITAGSGGNYVDGGDGTNTITTGGGVDTILTGNGADTIVAGAGNDIVIVTGGADTADAGAGSDLLIVDYSAAVTAVTGGVTGGNLASGYTGHLADLESAMVDFVETERFWITSGTGNDAIVTGAGDDRISTGDGDDTIDAGGGADILTGGVGEDAMSGGDGDDSYFVDNLGDRAIEASGQGYDIVYSAVDDFTLEAGSEVELLGTIDNFATTAIGLTGNELDNYVTGNAGSNTLDGGGGSDYLWGREGNDSYFADGNDVVLEYAGHGYDIVYARSSFVLGVGSAVEELRTVDDFAITAIDLNGNALDNLVVGNAGVNILRGGGGADTLQGLRGDDSYFVDANDIVVEATGGGRDIVYASENHTLAAGAFVEVLGTVDNFATTAINLTGNELANYVTGNAGNNTIDGGAGADSLEGRDGADTFAFTTALGGGNIDTILDFASGVDRIALDDAIFTGLGLGALSADAFVIGTQAGDADDRIVYNSSTGALYFDADGNGGGAAVQFATLQYAVPIVSSDFIVI